MKQLLIAALGAALVMSSGGLMAQERPGRPSFDSLDTNHDGALSKEEVQAMFDRFRNGGGRRGGFGTGRNGTNAKRGTNGGTPAGSSGGTGDAANGGASSGASDGPLQRPGIDTLFERWDKDGNGSVSKEEFDARPRFRRSGQRGGRGAFGGGGVRSGGNRGGFDGPGGRVGPEARDGI